MNIMQHIPVHVWQLRSQYPSPKSIFNKSPCGISNYSLNHHHPLNLHHCIIAYPWSYRAGKGENNQTCFISACGKQKHTVGLCNLVHLWSLLCHVLSCASICVHEIQIHGMGNSQPSHHNAAFSCFFPVTMTGQVHLAQFFAHWAQLAVSPAQVQATTLGNWIAGTHHCHGNIELLHQIGQKCLRFFGSNFTLWCLLFRNHDSCAKLSHRGACCTVEKRPSSASISSESLSDSFSSPVLRRFSRRSCNHSNPKVK